MLILGTMLHTFNHFLAALCHLFDIAFVELVIIGLDRTLELLLVLLVLFKLFLDILLLLLLSLMKLMNAPLVVDMAQPPA